MPVIANQNTQLRDRILAKIERDLVPLCEGVAKFKSTGILTDEKVRALIRESTPLLREHAMDFIIKQIEQAAVRRVAISH